MNKKTSKPDFIVAIDSREQMPYHYSNSKTKTLKTGDYSLVGFERMLSIERKTKEDIFSSLGSGRVRFEKEIKRLSNYDYGAIVIESTLDELSNAPKYTQMNPKSVINSLISWSIRYGVFVYFASDRKHARGLVYRIIEKYWKQQADDSRKK